MAATSADSPLPGAPCAPHCHPSKDPGSSWALLLERLPPFLANSAQAQPHTSSLSLLPGLSGPVLIQGHAPQDPQDPQALPADTVGICCSCLGPRVAPQPALRTSGQDSLPTQVCAPSAQPRPGRRCHQYTFLEGPLGGNDTELSETRIGGPGPGSRGLVGGEGPGDGEGAWEDGWPHYQRREVALGDRSQPPHMDFLHSWTAAPGMAKAWLSRKQNKN